VISEYYHAPIGEVLRAMLVAGSTGVGKTTVRAAVRSPPRSWNPSEIPLQQSVIAAARRAGEGGRSIAQEALGTGNLSQALHELRKKNSSPSRRNPLPGAPRRRPNRPSSNDTEAVKEWRKWLNLNEGNRRIGETDCRGAASRIGAGEVSVARLIRDHGLSLRRSRL